MSGIGSVAATRMDRLQNHVTGSLLLNVIENTAKLDKKITSSSSAPPGSEELTALQTKVNQLDDKVTKASNDVDNLTGRVESLFTSVVLNNPAEGATQIIKGKLTATDFTTTGGVSLSGLADSAVLKDPSGPQTISKNLTLSDGVLTIGSNVVDQTLLTVNGDIESTGTITAENITLGNDSGTSTLTSPIIRTDKIYSTSDPAAPSISFDNSSVNVGTSDGSKSLMIYGDTYIGDSSSSSIANLNVHGQITATDFTTGTVSLSGLADAVLKNPTGGAEQTITGKLTATDFTAGDVSLSGLANSAVLKKPTGAQTIYGNVIIGSSSNSANLSVNGVTQLNGKVTVGTSSLDDDADLNVNGNITSKTLQVNGVIAADNVTIGTSTTGDTVDLTVNGPTKLNGTVTIGKSSTATGADLNVNGQITAGNLEVNGSITSTGSVTIGGSTTANLMVPNGTINLGNLTISYDSVTGLVKFTDSTLGKSSSIILN